MDTASGWRTEADPVPAHRVRGRLGCIFSGRALDRVSVQRIWYPGYTCGRSTRPGQEPPEPGRANGRSPRVVVQVRRNDNMDHMPVVVDHVFICTAIGAPGADRLRQFGLVEGSPNQHPGQGTACRRFFFRNAMLEFLWVENIAEARSEQTRRTKLWERWSEAGRVTSPFGIVLRPALGAQEACPFSSWEYSPSSMPRLTLPLPRALDLRSRCGVTWKRAAHLRKHLQSNGSRWSTRLALEILLLFASFVPRLRKPH